MSLGSPIIQVRLQADELAVVDAVLEKRNTNSGRSPWTRSDFIRAALREKLEKMARSRKSRNRSGKYKQPAAAAAAEPYMG